eukprot:2352309-Pleurochrysis_carterae.AAC.2
MLRQAVVCVWAATTGGHFCGAHIFLASPAALLTWPTCSRGMHVVKTAEKYTAPARAGWASVLHVMWPVVKVSHTILEICAPTTERNMQEGRMVNSPPAVQVAKQTMEAEQQ